MQDTSHPTEACPICLEEFTESNFDNKYFNTLAYTKCLHKFHTHCLYKNNIEKCPLCRMEDCNYEKIVELHICNTNITQTYRVSDFNFPIDDILKALSKNVYGSELKFTYNRVPTRWLFDSKNLKWEASIMPIFDIVQGKIALHNRILCLPHKEFMQVYHKNFGVNIVYEKMIAINFINFLDKSSKKFVKNYKNVIPRYDGDETLVSEAYILKTFKDGKILIQLLDPLPITRSITIGGARFLLLYKKDLSGDFDENEKTALEDEYMYSYDVMSFNFHTAELPIHLLQKHDNFMDIDKNVAKQPDQYRIKIMED